MKETFTRWDLTEQLATEKARKHFLKAAIRDHGDDPAFIAQCLGVVARARGMARVAEETGLSRESLYKALSGKGNPGFSTIMRVAKTFGVELRI